MEGFRATEERIEYDVCVDGGVDTVGGGQGEVMMDIEKANEGSWIEVKEKR